MEQLDTSDKRRLLAIARRAIETATCAEPPIDRDAAAAGGRLAEPAAAFVTLHEHGRLRGCIGLLRFDVPLWQNVRDAAVAAAIDDPRFEPVDAAEVPTLEMEVSVLDPPRQIATAADFVAGRHGIIVERGARRALLLPQVATEMSWDEGQMLEAVCRKANLPGDAWRDRSTRLSVFDSTFFSEADLAHESAHA